MKETLQGTAVAYGQENRVVCSLLLGLTGGKKGEVTRTRQKVEKVALKGALTFSLGYSRPQSTVPEECQKEQTIKTSLPSFLPLGLLL